MAVISALIPTSKTAFVAGRGIVFGTEVVVVDREGHDTYVDVTGTAEKALLTLLGANAGILDVTNYTESKNPQDKPGQNGQGIPNHGENAYTKTSRLMGRPKFD